MKLMEGEEIVHELRPKPKLLVIWFFTKCLPWGLGGMFILPIFGDLESSNLKLIIPTVIGALFLISLGLTYCTFLRRTYVYYVTNQRCVFHGGILRRVERSIPYHKITDVEMSQNIVERILAISSLNIFTPGTASMYPSSPFGGPRAEISFVGLSDNETPATTINGILRKFKATGE